MRKLNFLTSNNTKTKEGNQVLEKYGIELIQIDGLKIEDKEKTIEEVAFEASKYASNKLKKELIVEDTGVYLDAYKGFPAQNAKLLMKGIGFDGIFRLIKGKKRNASFRTAIGYCKPNEKPIVFVGKTKGKITDKKIGKIDSNVSYDVIFIPDGYKKTFAQLPEVKKEISHRAKAFEKLGRYLAKNSP